MTVMICIMVMNHSELVSIPRTALSYDNRYGRTPVLPRSPPEQVPFCIVYALMRAWYRRCCSAISDRRETESGERLRQLRA
jgi:hypothetical protein